MKLMAFWRRKKAVTALILGAAVAGMGLLCAADLLCRSAARGRVFHDVASVPANDVGLVLGTSRYTARGSPNLHFQRRIATAAELYRSGKVRHLLVSGDNHTQGYDEPTDMMEALMAAGVPAEAITRDYAGFRTLDSVIRAKEVFGLDRCTIVTENFHCTRALWIARAHQIDAVAMAAPDLELLRWSARVKAREVLARGMCALDLYVLKRQPKFPGPPEPIIVRVQPGGTASLEMPIDRACLEGGAFSESTLPNKRTLSGEI